MHILYVPCIHNDDVFIVLSARTSSIVRLCFAVVTNTSPKDKHWTGFCNCLTLAFGSLLLLQNLASPCTSSMCRVSTTMTSPLCFLHVHHLSSCPFLSQSSQPSSTLFLDLAKCVPFPLFSWSPHSVGCANHPHIPSSPNTFCRPCAFNHVHSSAHSTVTNVRLRRKSCPARVLHRRALHQLTFSIGTLPHNFAIIAPDAIETIS